MSAHVILPLLLAGVLPAAAQEPALDLADPRHVRAVYLDLLGRTPDGDELDLALGARPEALLAVLTGTREFWEQWYEEELYYFLLLDNLRPEDPTDPEQGVPARLLRGELDALGAVRALVSGSAFQRANPGNDTFVSVVFEQLLGLTVQEQPALLEAGKRMYDGRRATLLGREGSSQADVVAIACTQVAFAERFVARQHERLVGLAAPGAEIARWAAELRRDPLGYPRLVREWLLSESYASRLARLRRKSDRQFLRGAFVDLVGRPPSLQTLRRYRAALAAVADPQPLRSVLVRALLDAEGVDLPPFGPNETAELVTTAFLRFLGRRPGPEELERLVLLHDQGSRDPLALLAAILTHWEYQYY